MSKQTKTKTAKKSNAVLAVTIVLLATISVFLIGGIIFYNKNNPIDRFNEGTKINELDVGGLTVQEASERLEQKVKSQQESLNINLIDGENVYTLTGKDFELNDNVGLVVKSVFDSTQDGFFNRKKKNYSEKDGVVNISYSNFLKNFRQKIDETILQINCLPQDATATFLCGDKKYSITKEDENIVINEEQEENNLTQMQSLQQKDEEKLEQAQSQVIESQEYTKPIKTEQFENNGVFTYSGEVIGKTVDKDKLISLLNEELSNNIDIEIKVPIIETMPNLTLDELKRVTAKRSEFSTDYSKSSSDRKHNVNNALSNFNGMVVMPNQEISFNQTIGKCTKENGYKDAKIIVGGEFVKGVGGGVCQASTTLYNALIRADIGVLEVHKHSLPVSYVPLAFDAMVSEGISDMRFKNTTSYPIYIKTYNDNNKVYTEIYGEAFPEGITINCRTNFVGVIPHSGDRIVADDGKYSNKVTFKGEYLRIRYPKEGYESQGFVQKFKDGELIEEKLIRHEKYMPIDGIIVEGIEDVYDGISIPSNNVKFISPQKSMLNNQSQVDNKIKNTNQNEFEP